MRVTLSEETLDNLRVFVRGRSMEDSEALGTHSLSYTVDDAVAELIMAYWEEKRKNILGHK
jgi:hypothetical protein